MKTVEIIYRYGTPSTSSRPRPSDTNSARVRLTEGNRRFSSLLEGLADDRGTVSRIVEIDARDLGIQADEHGTPSQLPFAAVRHESLRRRLGLMWWNAQDIVKL